ncbi:hypothetical protein A3B63_02095 [Candidatus Saccharibacteria bacterium RIFCSPLOWO2_01_FULL_49_22]|nr:MAG: hypothetical protein A3B63_02095 [Candidatus Saccharibacteria bacterium RIFCSPLOWO2_01_FULL_49_22]
MYQPVCRLIHHQENKNMTYSSSVATQSRPQVRRNQNSVAFGAAAKSLGPVSNTIILLFLFALIGLLYLTQVTKTNSFGYSINELRQQRSQLQDEKADLEIASARLRSLDRVAQSEVAKSLVPTTPTGTVQ